MKTTLTFNAAEYDEKTLRLILSEAERRKCSPSEALRALINQLAEKAKFEPTPERRKAA